MHRLRYSRRKILGLTALGLGASLYRLHAFAQSVTEIRKKAIPVTGELLPVIGMGTWRTFNVGENERLLAQRTQIVRAFLAHGGRLVDSSPMYGSAPDTMGYALRKLGYDSDLFAAEKVWSPAGGDTTEQFDSLLERWGLKRFDLVQVHNLHDWREHLENLTRLKQEGRLRYIGITTSHGRRHPDMEAIMESEAIDFVQLSYNIHDREAEERLLPMAQEKGIAVIANRPFDGGSLIRNLKRNHPVPSWAKDSFHCLSWADYLLRFIVSHPAITCAIPATSKLEHLNENMLSGKSDFVSPAIRQKMIEHLATL